MRPPGAPCSNRPSQAAQERALRSPVVEGSTENRKKRKGEEDKEKEREKGPNERAKERENRRPPKKNQSPAATKAAEERRVRRMSYAVAHPHPHQEWWKRGGRRMQRRKQHGPNARDARAAQRGGDAKDQPQSDGGRLIGGAKRRGAPTRNTKRAAPPTPYPIAPHRPPRRPRRARPTRSVHSPGFLRPLASPPRPCKATSVYMPWNHLRPNAAPRERCPSATHRPRDRRLTAAPDRRPRAGHRNRGPTHRERRRNTSQHPKSKTQLA